MTTPELAARLLELVRSERVQVFFVRSEVEFGWVPDDSAHAALDRIRDNDPFYTAGVAQHELLCWNVVIGKEDLDRL